jgi:hypothetical protein
MGYTSLFGIRCVRDNREIHARYKLSIVGGGLVLDLCSQTYITTNFSEACDSLFPQSPITAVESACH